jgi:hypothetical protein
LIVPAEAVAAKLTSPNKRRFDFNAYPQFKFERPLKVLESSARGYQP